MSQNIYMCLLLLVLITNSLASEPVAADRFGRRIRSVIPSSGRVIEEYSETVMRLLDADKIERLARQDAIDGANDLFTPLIGNQTHEKTVLGTITLGPIFARGPTSVLFEIVEFPHLLIKYQVNCDEDEMHPMLPEAWYGGRAYGVGIAPPIVALSPPVGLCATSSGKCTTKMSMDEYDECRRDGIGILRYLIMGKIEGMDLQQFRVARYPRGQMGLRDAAIVGAKLFRILEILHANATVVHGDIYPPNVMAMIPATLTHVSEVDLQLVDFGRAFIVSSTPLPDRPVLPKIWFHHLCTHWQMEGYMWARRDDVMKTVQTIIELMHPVAFLLHENSVKEKGFGFLMRWKTLERMYVSPLHNPVGVLQVPLETKIRLYNLLDELLALARSLRINAPIPYQTMIGILEEIVSTISNTTMTVHGA